MNELLIKVPDTTVITEEGMPDTYAAIMSVDGRWTGDPAHGTRSYDGDKLIVAKVAADAETVEQMIANLELDWTVLAAKDEIGMIRECAEDTVMPFMPDKPVLDEDGEITGYERPQRAVVGRYAGSPEWEFV